MNAAPLDPAKLPALSRLIDQAMDLDEAAREALIAGLEGEEAELGPLLRRLFDPDAAAAAEKSLKAVWLEAPSAGTSGDGDLWATLGDDDPAPGREIGPYTLERELGRGGMGAVWLASRSDGAYRRQVALKLPLPHRLIGRGRGRFRRERDILAALTHPNIAQFLDAGIDASGQAYLALEWVVGRPITEACRQRRASLGDRLALIRQVTDAVHYAHGRLIVHRDIKPSNVLVTDEGRVQLLDFGIAKLLERTDDLTATQLTREGESVATPDYAAPEQLLGGAITVATDVYAIGILLFELLTGNRPFARASAWSPPQPGEVAIASRRVAAGHEETMRLDLRALVRMLAGDLDAILAKALAFEAAERYQSVEALAADLDRYSRSEPIAARRIGRLLRLGKFVRRHRVGVGLGSALALAVAIGVGGVLWQAAETAREARRAEATKNFLIGVFTGSDPRIASDRPRGETTARELVDRAAARIDGELRDDPATRLELLDLTATIYLYLDEIDKARPLVRLEVESAETLLRPHDSRLLDAMMFEIWTDLQAGDHAAATERLDRFDRHLRRHGLDGSRHRAEYFLAFGDLALAGGDIAAREAALDKARALYEAEAPDDRGLPATLANLGSLARGRGDQARALALFDRALVVLRRQQNTAIEIARLESRRGRVLAELGRDPDAEAAFEAARRGFAQTLGASHLTAWQATAGLAHLRCRQGRHPEADALFGEIPARHPGEGPGERTRHAEVDLLRGLCLATRPGHENAARPLLDRALAELAGQHEYAEEIRQAGAARESLATLPSRGG